jgi:hypothetical protein
MACADSPRTLPTVVSRWWGSHFMRSSTCRVWSCPWRAKVSRKACFLASSAPAPHLGS